MSSPARVNILLFWFYDDWGWYGRTYEKIASNLAGLPEVGQVVCMFPPEIVADPGESVGLHERWVSPKLTLLTERIRAHDASLLGRVFRSARGWKGSRLLSDYFSGHNFTSRNTILWLFPPHPYIDRIRAVVPHRLVVTHVIDNFTHFDRSHWLYRHAVDQYPRIGRWSDIIFTHSESNQAEFSTAGVPCHRFAQAVDECFLATPSDLPHRAMGARPRLGYLGFIMARTDLALLAGVAAQRPDWDVVLVGPEYPPGQLRESGLLALENVRWLGEVPNREAPAFLQSLDVCLIPHRDNKYSRSMRPLKLYQYLGSGRPVVSTPVGGLEDLIDHVQVAHDAAGFVSRIQDSLDNDSIEQSMARIDAVRRETWDIRAREMLLTAIQASRR
jgi:glycosyltransferase involved in cell wall biosynthesis